MSPAPELEPQSTFFLAKWTVEIALGLIGLLTAYVLKIKGRKVEVVNNYQLKSAILEMRHEIQKDTERQLENNKEEIIRHIKDILEAGK